MLVLNLGHIPFYEYAVRRLVDNFQQRHRQYGMHVRCRKISFCVIVCVLTIVFTILIVYFLQKFIGTSPYKRINEAGKTFVFCKPCCKYFRFLLIIMRVGYEYIIKAYHLLMLESKYLSVSLLL